MKYSLILCLFFLLVSCSVRPSKINNKKAFSKRITYFKDERTGLCFGAVATMKKTSFNQNGIGLTCVPCERIPEELFK